MRKWMLAILTLALLLTGVASAEEEPQIYDTSLGRWMDKADWVLMKEKTVDWIETTICYALPEDWDQVPDKTPDGFLIDPDGKTYDSISETIWGVPRYRLPDGFRYGEGASVITPSGLVYDNILDVQCMFDLCMYHPSWGMLTFEDLERDYLLPGLTPELGDDSASLTLLGCAAALTLAGAIFARRKAKHA